MIEFQKTKNHSEPSLFGHMEKGPKRKWLKNLLRTVIMAACALGGYFGGDHIQNVNGVIGAL
jgi:hypothetical protein